MTGSQAPDDPEELLEGYDDADEQDENASSAEPSHPPDEAVEQLESQLRRTLADLDNLRKRYGRDLERERAVERARLAAEWLPVVDNLELALQHADDADGAVVEGVRAVHEQAVATLARFGFPRLEPVGQTFDPVVHEAVSTVQDEENEGTVVAVTRPGYGTSEALLRPAGVVVAKR